MKILISIYSLFFICIFSLSNRTRMNSKSQIDFNEIKKEIEWFINKVKPESVGQGRYNVYVAKIYEEEGRYCVTMGIIQDSLFVSYSIGFKHFIKVNGDLVLLDYMNKLKNKYEFEQEEVQSLTDVKIIQEIIYKEGVIIGTTPGYVCCYEEGNIRKMYYENSDQIPFDKSIFKYTPKGELIELDSSSLKKMIREKGKN